MATHSFGSVTNTSNTGYPSSDGIYHDGTPQPTGRLAANGKRPIWFGSPSVVSAYGAGGISVSIDSRDFDLGGGYCSDSGGGFRLRIDYSSGTLYFGRDSAMGGTVYDTGDNTTWTGGIPGSVSWTQAPTAPRTPAASSPIPGKITATWLAPTSDGDTAILGYRVQVARDALFTIGVVNVDVGNVLTADVTGLVNGADYYVRVFAKNAVTNAASTTSVASTTATARVKAGPRRWDATAGVEVPTSTFVRWDATAGVEVPITTFVRWDATAGVEVPVT